jgi:hypothetical protein
MRLSVWAAPLTPFDDSNENELHVNIITLFFFLILNCSDWFSFFNNISLR